MTTYFTTAIRAATKDETWILDTGTSLSTTGTTINAAGLTTGQNFIIKGDLTSTGGTAFVLGSSALADSDTSIRIDYVASFTASGIGILAYGGGVDFLNIGTVKTGSTGLKLLGDGNTVENDGTMVSTGGSVIVTAGDGDTIANNDGSLKAKGNVIVSSGDSVTIANNALIVSTTARGIVSTGSDAAITNNETIRSTLDGIRSTGDGADIRNHKLITSSAGAGIASLGDDASITNTTTVSGKTYGVSSSGDDLSLTNYATIKSTGTAVRSTGDDATIINKALLSGDVALTISGDGSTVTNSHIIKGTSETKAAIIVSSSGDTTLNTTGAVHAASGVVFQSGKGAETVTNTGSLYGDVKLGAGNDTFCSLKGEVTGTVYGGAGNDLYKIGIDATLKEYAGQGVDTVQSTISWALGANFENLTLIGSSKINGTGNGLDNTIIGNSVANVLTGGRGDDVLTGSGGADTFVFARQSGDDTITDFQNGKDHIDLTGYSGIDDFGDIASIKTVQGDAVITLSGGDTITLEDIKAATITANDFLF